MNFALLPVKSPARAKERLATVLSAAQREQLARLMFGRVLEVLLQARGFDRVVVASDDADILRRAHCAGAAPLAETMQNGHSCSADWAAGKCLQWGATTLFMVPIDVPLLTARELEAVLDSALAMPEPRLVIVPSADGAGTNALVRTPPDVIESRFGPGSFAAHISQANEKRVAVAVARPDGLVFDLDTPEDVAEYLRRAPAGPIADFLRSCGLEGE